MSELNYVTTRNRLTGIVDKYTPLHVYEHPILGQHLELVDEDTKPLVPELINTDKVEAKPKAPEAHVTSEKKD